MVKLSNRILILGILLEAGLLGLVTYLATQLSQEN